MALALYDPEYGYYARAAQRSGRAGDFFTSVDVGSLFGELLAVQLAEMFELLEQSPVASRQSPVASPKSPVDLVEAGAGNGRLANDILRVMKRDNPSLFARLQVHLVETSAAARAAQRDALGDGVERLASSSAELPSSFEGVLIANELLDAMPTHQVVMREDGLQEIFVAARRPFQSRLRDGDTESVALHAVEGSPSTPDLQRYLNRLGVALEPGWRVEINLAAVEWVRDAARRLRRGFMILIDYGHEARELYSASHSAGTLTSLSGHRSAGTEASGAIPPWLATPGERDITAHVDFTSVRAAAEAEGMTTIAFLDQTYFLLGLVDAWSADALAERSAALKTLIAPGGLGSTMKVLILGKGVGGPALKGCSFKVRAT